MMLMALVGIPLIIVLIGFATEIVSILREDTDRLRPGH